MSLRLSRALVLLACAGLAACGWHLRGSLQLPAGLDSVYIASEGDSQELARSLRQLLEANDVAVQGTPAAAPLHINLHDYEEERRVVAIGDNTLVTEYELTSEALVSIAERDGELLLPETRLSISRSYRFDQNNVLAMDEEERLIQEEIRRDLVQQMLRHLRFLNTPDPQN